MELLVALWLLSVTPGKVPWWGQCRDQWPGMCPGKALAENLEGGFVQGQGLCDTLCFQAGKGDVLSSGLGRGVPVG